MTNEVVQTIQLAFIKNSSGCPNRQILTSVRGKWHNINQLIDTVLKEHSYFQNMMLYFVSITQESKYKNRAIRPLCVIVGTQQPTKLTFKDNDNAPDNHTYQSS